MAMELISTQTVSSSGLNAWTFSSIPQTYETLLLKINVADSTAGTGRNDFWAVLNSDSQAGGSYYYSRFLFYDGNNKLVDVSSTGVGAGHAMPGTGNGARFGAYELVIPNYTNTTINKTGHFQGGYASASGQSFINNVTFINQNNTQAVSSITFKAAGSGQFAINSTISIYGLK
jgi:hypothetical protein